MRRPVLPIALACAALGALAWRSWTGAAKEREPERAAALEYVGRAACAECHADEAQRFAGSDHDLAMQEANEHTVLGDFGGASLTHFGRTSSFVRRGDEFVIRTDGPDGELHDYPVAYTFGHWPLQQYLVAFPGGRYQVSSLCWDARPKEAGGQRWFHLYPDEPVPHDDVLHWTGPNQNWNFMCAECHSTDLRKNYALETDAYATSWAEIDVSCEACHGPGSAHVAWAKASERSADPQMGLALSLRDGPPAEWRMDETTGIAHRVPPRSSQSELEACARCHARRGVAWPEYEPGHPLADTHRPALLAEGLYYPDGQIEDEVYVYGSFLQSRMHANGVTCSDCHDPHSLAIPKPVDSVCERCHATERFAAPSHHHHELGSEGASCVACHMPQRTYMVVDPRRDHSFRVPRPDLTLALGVPNACDTCHADRGAKWASEAVSTWFPYGRGTEPHYGEAIDAGRRGAPGAAEKLARVALDAAQPAIARGSALSLLAPPQGASAFDALRAGVADPDPLVRLGALESLESAEPAVQRELVARLFGDPARVVRQRAAEIASAWPAGSLSGTDRARYEAALGEYVAEQEANAERAGSHLNLGNLRRRQGALDEARREYELGLRLDARFGPLYANLADLHRERGDEAQVERVLRDGLAALPKDASLHHALGLALVRQHRLDDAVVELERAAELEPGVARHGLALGLALEAQGNGPRAVAALEQALARNPNDRELLRALLQSERERGELDAALEHARRLAALEPADLSLRELVSQLEQQQR